MLAGLARLEYKVSILERSIQSTNGGRSHSSGSNSRSQRSLNQLLNINLYSEWKDGTASTFIPAALPDWTPMLSKLIGEKLLSYQVQLIKKFNSHRLTIISHSVLSPTKIIR